MALPGQPLQLHRGRGPKRTSHREIDRASKRRKHPPCDRRSATRPLTSSERLWGETSTLLYCSEMDKDIFRISFERMENESEPVGNDSEPASQTKAKRLLIAKKLKRYIGDAKLLAMKALLALDGVRPWERGQGRRLQLRYGYVTSVVAIDGVFRKSSTGPEIGYVDLAQLQQMKDSHIMSLLQKAETEEKQDTARIAEEQRRIKPNKAEEDAQIALIMVAMAQEMLRSGEPDQLDAWVKVIGISKSEIFLYRALVPKKFVQTFDASTGFVIQYRSASLNDRSGVLQQLHRLLAEEVHRGDQPGAAAEAKC